MNIYGFSARLGERKLSDLKHGQLLVDTINRRLLVEKENLVNLEFTGPDIDYWLVSLTNEDKQAVHSITFEQYLLDATNGFTIKDLIVVLIALFMSLVTISFAVYLAVYNNVNHNGMGDSEALKFILEFGKMVWSIVYQKESAI